jgi:[ribosomal protein S5]-alanine N-acetyltransferase
MINLPQLSNTRIILRPIISDDFEAIFKLRSSPVVNKFILRKKQQTKTVVQEYMSIVMNGYKEDLNYTFAITLEEKLIGTICLWGFSEDRKTAEIGYDLSPEYHNKGYGSEAVSTILDFAKECGFLKLEAFTHRENIPSIKMLEKQRFIWEELRFDKGFPHNVVYGLKIDSN